MADEKTVSKPEEKKEKRSLTLKLAGWSYILGDAAMMIAGKRREQGDVFKGAAIWMAGGIGAALFGNPKIETQVKIQANKLEHYLKKKGIDVTDDARQGNDLLKKQNLWEHVKQFCYEHPSEILNTAYAIGAAMLIHGGYMERFHPAPGAEKHRLLPEKINLKSIKSISSGVAEINRAMAKVTTQFWMGSLILPGALIGLFWKEDAKAKEKAKNGNVVDKTLAFITEKPLRVSAGLYFLNNAFLALRFGQDLHLRGVPQIKDKITNKIIQEGYAGLKVKPHIFSGAQLLLYICANTLLLMSPRNQITDKGFDTDSMGKLEDAAAQIIASQPRDVQQKVLADISEYMAKEKGVNMDASTIAQHLAARVGKVTETNLQETGTSMKWAEREAARKQTSAEVAQPMIG